MQVERDVWLSDIFGYDAFRVSWHDDSAARDSRSVDRNALVSALHQAGPAFYYAKVPTTRIDTVQTLGAVGFSVVDVQVAFAHRPTPEVETAQDHAIVMQDIQPVHHDAVRDIAASCFVYSRFHLDPAIPRRRANAVKRAWIDSYIGKRRGERLLVGVLDHKPVGFLAVLSTTHHGAPCHVLDLLGVATASQGRGVGRALVSYFLQQYAGHLLRVGTQVANIPSIRLYESLGFRMDETFYVLHAHMAPTAGLQPAGLQPAGLQPAGLHLER